MWLQILIKILREYCLVLHSNNTVWTKQIVQWARAHGGDLTLVSNVHSSWAVSSMVLEHSDKFRFWVWSQNKIKKKWFLLEFSCIFLGSKLWNLFGVGQTAFPNPTCYHPYSGSPTASPTFLRKSHVNSSPLGSWFLWSLLIKLIKFNILGKTFCMYTIPQQNCENKQMNKKRNGLLICWK